MSRMTLLFVLFSWVSFAQNGSSIQSDSEHYNAIVHAQQQLEIVLRTDKLLYLPGEEIVATVSIRNPTNESLQVFDPFSPAISHFWTITPGKPNNLQSDSPARFTMPMNLLTVFAPKEERSKLFGFDRSFLYVAAPAVPGKHKLLFLFFGNKGESPLEVVDAELENAFEFVLPSTRREQRVESRAAASSSEYQRIVSVRSATVSRLCLSIGTTPNSLEYSRFREKLASETRMSQLRSFFGVLRCVAESDSPITSVEATFSNDGTMLLISTAADKSTRKLYVDKQNRVIP